MNKAAILPREVELLYRNLPLGQVVSLINASLLVAVNIQGNHHQLTASLIWYACACTLAFVRLWGCHRYRARSGPVDVAHWHQQGFVGAAAAGVWWGIGGLFFCWEAPVAHQLFTAFVMAGMVSGAVPVLAADLRAFRWFAVPTVLCIFIGLLGEDLLHFSAAAMALLFLAASLRSAEFFHQTLHDSLQLEIEKDKLLESLQSAKLAAEQSNHAKSEFLANVSHELRTPMNGILGMAELIAMESPTPDQQALLTPLRESANDLLLLINNLIELSSIEAGHLQLQPTPFIIDDLLSVCASAHHDQATEKSISIERSSDPEMPEVLIGDIRRLRQVLDHLLENAIKFSEHGTISVDAKYLVSAAQTCVRFSVRDQGCGIPKDKINTITALFSPVDGSATRRTGGTGIGLPISRRLVELMGGQLEIESQVGAGSCFSFTLPLVTATEFAQASTAQDAG